MKRLIKFNGGAGAILCNRCKVIVKQGDGISKEDLKSTEPLFCIKCKPIVDYYNIEKKEEE